MGGAAGLFAGLLLAGIVLLFSRSGELPRSTGPTKHSHLLLDVPLLDFYHGKQTTARRSDPVPQLTCVGGNACMAHSPQHVRCHNRGGTNGFDVRWACEDQGMPASVRFGKKFFVYCEGWLSSDDEYVLKGSCGLEYELHTVDEMDRRTRTYERTPSQRRPASEQRQHTTAASASASASAVTVTDTDKEAVDDIEADRAPARGTSARYGRFVHGGHDHPLWLALVLLGMLVLKLWLGRGGADGHTGREEEQRQQRSGVSNSGDPADGAAAMDEDARAEAALARQRRVLLHVVVALAAVLAAAAFAKARGEQVPETTKGGAPTDTSPAPTPAVSATEPGSEWHSVQHDLASSERFGTFAMLAICASICWGIYRNQDDQAQGSRVIWAGLAAMVAFGWWSGGMNLTAHDKSAPNMMLLGGVGCIVYALWSRGLFSSPIDLLVSLLGGAMPYGHFGGLGMHGFGAGGWAGGLGGMAGMAAGGFGALGNLFGGGGGVGGGAFGGGGRIHRGVRRREHGWVPPGGG